MATGISAPPTCSDLDFAATMQLVSRSPAVLRRHHQAHAGRGYGAQNQRWDLHAGHGVEVGPKP